MKFLLVVESNIAEFFLDVFDNFLFGRGGESYVLAALSKQLAEIFGEISSGEIISLDSMG